MEAQHADNWAAVPAHRPGQDVHHHYVNRPKWSPDNFPQSQKNGKRAYTGEFQSSRTSVVTERHPLLDSSISAALTSQQVTIDDSRSFAYKYGRDLKILHYGTNGTIRLHLFKPRDPGLQSKLCAVKVYRNDIISSQSNSLPRASCCSTTFISGLHPHHPNILPILDLLYNDHSQLCLVMPFCAGGDLHELLKQNETLPSNEADCILSQILRALCFLHDNKTAHRDMRLETVLLTENGSVKLAGFGDSHVRHIWEKCMIPSEFEEESPPDSHSPSSWPSWLIAPFSLPSFNRRPSAGDSLTSSASYPGLSLPFIAPEAFHRYYNGLETSNGEDRSRDPRPADIWGAAIIYMALVNGRLPWKSARPHHEDPRYEEYLELRESEDGFPLIESLGGVCCFMPVNFYFC